MLPTLKDSYTTQLEKRLQECRKNPELLREAIDQSVINEMEKSLNKLSQILRAPELETLTSFHHGLQKAHDELSNVLSYGDVRRWAHSLLPKGFTALGRVTTFTTGVSRLLKQLPQLITIARGGMGEERRADWDPDQPLDELLDTRTAKKMTAIIINSMKPPSSLSFLSSGLPYIKDDEAAAEILGLSFNQLNSLKIPDKSTAPTSNLGNTQEIFNDIQALIGVDDDEDDLPDAGPPPATRKQATTAPKVVLPPPAGTPTPEPKPEPSASEKPKEHKQPSTIAIAKDFDAIFDQAILAKWGEDGLRSRKVKAIKDILIKQAVKYMKSKKMVR